MQVGGEGPHHAATCVPLHGATGAVLIARGARVFLLGVEGVAEGRLRVEGRLRPKGTVARAGITGRFAGRSSCTCAPHRTGEMMEEEGGSWRACLSAPVLHMHACSRAVRARADLCVRCLHTHTHTHTHTPELQMPTVKPLPPRPRCTTHSCVCVCIRVFMRVCARARVRAHACVCARAFSLSIPHSFPPGRRASGNVEGG
jgi:hypothetical protein